MDIRFFQEYMTLVMHRNFTSAARELYISQSTLSRHIDALERDLGAELIYKSQPFALTEAGKVVMRHAPAIMNSYDAIVEQLEQLKNQQLIRIRIQDLLSLEPLFYGINKAIDDTKARYPYAVFDFVKTKYSSTIKQALTNDEIDVGFQRNLSPEPHTQPSDPSPEFRYIPIYDYQAELAFGIGKPLYEQMRGRELGFADFAGRPLMREANRANEEFDNDLKAICEREGFKAVIEYVTTNSDNDFYSREPGEMVVPLCRMPEGNTTPIDRHIKRNLVVIRPKSKHGPYLVTAHVLARVQPSNEVLDYFLERLEAIEEEARPASPDTSS